MRNLIVLAVCVPRLVVAGITVRDLVGLASSDTDPSSGEIIPHPRFGQLQTVSVIPRCVALPTPVGYKSIPRRKSIETS